MSERKTRTALLADVIRWTAKVWSLATIGLVLLIFVGEAVSPSTPAAFTPSELVGLLFFPIGVCLGMILAWRREALGGGVTVASVVAFYVWMYLDRASFPHGPYFVLIAAPGILFILAALLSRSAAGQSHTKVGKSQPSDPLQS
jgi:FtsH-binding integral membrane protein